VTSDGAAAAPGFSQTDGKPQSIVSFTDSTFHVIDDFRSSVDSAFDFFASSCRTGWQGTTPSTFIAPAGVSQRRKLLTMMAEMAVLLAGFRQFVIVSAARGAGWSGALAPIPGKEGRR
jgi:hypothetical protein